MISRIRKSLDEKDQGFTLIELLVVIIIIGILAAIAIPVFLNQRKKAVEASMKSDLRTVAEQLETVYTDSQTYYAVTGSAGAASIATPTTATPVTLSPGNVVVSISADGLAYCLKATNAKTAAIWYYDSDGGGLSSTVCS